MRRWKWLWRWSLMLAVAGGAGPALAAQLPDVDVVLQRMIDRADETQDRFKKQELTYAKRSVLEILSHDGKVKDREEKLYEILFKQGRVRMTVLEVNGHETEAARQTRRAAAEELKPPRGEERPLVLTREMLDRYQFNLVGEAEVGARNCFVLSFEPRSGLKENGMIDKFLNRLGGKIWVDQEEYELTRAELGLQAPVHVLGGLAGAVNRFHYTLERTPAETGVWFNRASRSDFEVRKLLVSRRYRTESEWRKISLE